jgi:hypothetical protein
LFFTPTGYPVLIEVKLWKNEESRRKVVVQILEYAKDLAELSYRALNDKVRKLRSIEAWGENPLFEIISQYKFNHPGEAEFVDRVTRNLREGRFLLLILGDGVRQNMESLANYLMHHSLRYDFGIVQIRLFAMPDGSVLAIPDIMAKTQTIERHATVVTVQGNGATVIGREPQRFEERKTSLSLDSFFEYLGQSSPAEVSWLKGFIQLLVDLGIEPEVKNNGASLKLNGTMGNGDTTGLMYIIPPYAQFWGVNYGGTRKTEAGRQAISTYCGRIAALFPGATIVTAPDGGMDIKINGKGIPITMLHGRETELKLAMGEFLKAVSISEDA